MMLNHPPIHVWVRLIGAEATSALVAECEAIAAGKVTRRRAVKRENNASRRTREVAWADQDVIRAIYQEAQRLTLETGVRHHVDHELPLHGKLVSGLHVENNLRVLPAVDNLRKHNRFEVGE